MARRADDDADSLERALAPRRGHRWRALALGALVLAVCAAVFGAISSRSLLTAHSPTVRPAVHHNQPCPARVTSRPTEITIQPDRDGIGLVQNLAWSPLGTCIAVLATQTTRSGAPGPPLLATYAPTTGTLLSLVPLTTALTRALAGDPRATASLSGLSVEYGDPLWLPDGQHVVITVTALTPDELTPRLAGVLLVDDQGLQPYALLVPSGSTPPVVEWDLASGGAQVITALPLALDYRWDPDGTLRPVTTLTTTAPPPTPALSPIGDPAGGPSFTVWQPGLVYIALAPPTPGANVALPGAYVWQTNFAALAPDGRHLITGLNVTDRLEPRGRRLPSRRQLADLHLDQAAVLPMRDPSLEAILDALNPLGPPVSETPTILSWSPNGRLLATRPGFIQFGLSPRPLEVYDCATGRRVASLGAGLSPGEAFGDGFRPRWSPDSTRLAAYDFDPQTRLGVLTIWNIASIANPGGRI